MALATTKQIDLLLRLWTRSGQLWEGAERHARAHSAACTQGYIATYTTWLRDTVLPQWTVADMDTAIKAAHARLGWDAKTAPATDAQRLYICSLERRVLGRVETFAQTKLTYAEADAKIRNLKANTVTVPDTVPLDWNPLEVDL